MSIIEHGKCSIESLSNNGLGVSRTALGTLELPYTIPGELVEFERHEYRRQANTIVKNIITASPFRIKPECRYFGVCGGCAVQHLRDDTYRNFKLQVVVDTLIAAEIHTPIDPIIFLPPKARRRANLKCVKKGDKVFLGFYRARSHQIINIDACIALSSKLSQLIEPINNVMNKVLRDKQKAQVFLNEVSNGVDVLIDLGAESLCNPSPLVPFAKQYDITRIVLRRGEALEIVYCSEQPYIVFGETRVETEADCFLQSSFAADAVLQDLVCKALSSSDAAHVVDLFCGRGTFALPLSRHFNVDGFESDSSAVSALSNVMQNIKLRDLYKKPITTDELQKYQYAVINPPRFGAREQVTQLAVSNLQKIVYVSCDLGTFTRDAKILCQSKYKLLQLTPVDQFYWNSHMEVVALFVPK